jgi:hypothetical protein
MALPNLTIESKPARYSMRALAAGMFSIRVVMDDRTLRDPFSDEEFVARCAEIFVTPSGKPEFRVEAPDDIANGIYPSVFWVVRGGVLMDAFALHSGRPNRRWTKELWAALAAEIAPYQEETAEPVSDLELEAHPVRVD